jgi:Protein of unknown function (DUF3124)
MIARRLHRSAELETDRVKSKMVLLERQRLMAARDLIARSVSLGLMVGLLGACSQPQQPSPSNSDKPAPVGELIRLPPLFPNEEVSSLDTLKAGHSQTVFVPAYSHVYYRTGQEYLLAITLSVRNTSLTDSILLTSVRYYDTKGNLAKEYPKKFVQIPPMATAEFFVQDEDTSGGSGANFIVNWTAKKGISEPVVEAVMIGTTSGQGISFTSSGRVIYKK